MPSTSHAAEPPCTPQHVKQLVDTLTKTARSVGSADEDNWGLIFEVILLDEPLDTALNKPHFQKLRSLRPKLQRCRTLAVPSLLPLLDDPRLSVSEAAANALQTLHDDALKPALITYALKTLIDPRPRSKLDTRPASAGCSF
ncbi:MAG: hypothetical protein U1A78_39935 [Polyangia bacterium]